MNATNWNHTTMRDTGNGAVIHTSTSAAFDGVQQKEFCSYCGREKERTWYVAINDDAGLQFATPTKAQKRYEQIVRERDQSDKIRRLESKLASRR